MKFFDCSLLRFPLLFIALLSTFSGLAQQASVKGTLAESTTSAPLAYASVRVLQLPDNKLVGGALTDAQRAELLAVAEKCPVHKLMTRATTEVHTELAARAD